MGEHARPRGRHEGQRQPVSRTGLIALVLGVLAVLALISAGGKMVADLTDDSRPAVGIAVSPHASFAVTVPAVPAQDVPRRHAVVPPHVRQYTVRAGDCLWTIAMRQLGNGARWHRIARLNHLSYPWVIHDGQVLRL